MLKRILIALVLALGVLSLGATDAKASHDVDSTSVRHAYRPYTNRNTRETTARVDNFIPMDISRLVCVEAFNVATGHKTHLGCLTVELKAYNSTTGNWAFEFNAPTYMLGQGKYRVKYTYQDMNGNWRLIKSVLLNIQDGTFVNP